jgi:hypothetical protein
VVSVGTLPGATVSATAAFSSGPVTLTGTADGSGLLTLSFPVGVSVLAGSPVTVTVGATSVSLGATAFTSAAFTPE